MKLIRTEEAVGQVLCHDITKSLKTRRKMYFARDTSSARKTSRALSVKGLHIYLGKR